MHGYHECAVGKRCTSAGKEPQPCSGQGCREAACSSTPQQAAAPAPSDEVCGSYLLMDMCVRDLSGDATVDLFLTAQEYFLSGPDSVETALSAPAFTILPEINLIELDKGTVMLGSYDTSGDFLMTFSVSETDFSGADRFGLGLYAKSYHANASGVAEESYQFTDGSVTRFTESVFF